MLDITDQMNSYRECSRNVWNTYFGVHDNWWNLESAYNQIRKLLFESLVLAQLTDQGSPADRANHPPVLRVVPFESVPVLLRRDSGDGNIYWDQEPELRASKKGISLTFVDYYDFFQHPIRDFRFYRCKVLKFRRHVEYEGKEALVDVANARIQVP